MKTTQNQTGQDELSKINFLDTCIQDLLCCQINLSIFADQHQAADTAHVYILCCKRKPA